LSWRWQFLQSADESLSDEVTGRVANPLAAAQGAAAGDGPSADRRRLSAAASGRREREAAAGRGQSLKRRSARDADAMGGNPSGGLRLGERVGDL
jgi:hypothetical protein